MAGIDVTDDDRDDAFKREGTRNARIQWPVHDLEVYCVNLASKVTGSVPPRWSCVKDGNYHQAFVEIVLFGIPHTFPGKHSDSQDDACNDTARRVLWYFGQPGYEDAFEPDLEFAKEVAHSLPGPSSSWAKDSAPSFV